MPHTGSALVNLCDSGRAWIVFLKLLENHSKYLIVGHAAGSIMKRFVQCHAFPWFAKPLGRCVVPKPLKTCRISRARMLCEAYGEACGAAGIENLQIFMDVHVLGMGFGPFQSHANP